MIVIKVFVISQGLSKIKPTISLSVQKIHFLLFLACDFLLLKILFSCLLGKS